MSLASDQMLERLLSRASAAACGSGDVLGPDLFDRQRPTPTPEFLAGHDYGELSPAQTLRFFALLNLLKPTPTHEQMDPASWKLDNDDSKRIALPPPRRPRTNWSPRSDAEPLPESIEAGIPKVWFTIWTGWGANRVLRPVGRSANFWRVWSASTSVLPEITYIHLTEATRTQIHHALTHKRKPDKNQGRADVRNLAHWARAHRIILINTDELLATDGSGWICRALRARRTRRDGSSLAEFSDLLRLWLVYQFGGLYLDGNKPLLSRTIYTDVAASPPGCGVAGGNNAAFLAFPRHPLLRAMLTQVRENYGKDQVQLARDGSCYQGIDLGASSVEAVGRLPVIERTGPAMVHRVRMEAGWSVPANPRDAQLVEIPIREAHEGSWRSETVEPRRNLSPVEIDDTVADLANRLIADLDDARGHLDLIDIESPLTELPNPHDALAAIFGFLAARADLRTRIQGVFNHHWKYDKPTRKYTLTPFAYQDTVDHFLHYLPHLPPLIGDHEGVWLLHKKATRAILLAPGDWAPTPLELATHQARTRPDDFGLYHLPDDPWPQRYLDEALNHVNRTLRPDDLPEARRLLATVASQNRIRLETSYFPPEYLSLCRHAAAAFLGLHDHDPERPLTLPGLEGRLLSAAVLSVEEGLSDEAATAVIGAVELVHRKYYETMLTP